MKFLTLNDLNVVSVEDIDIDNVDAIRHVAAGSAAVDDPPVSAIGDNFLACHTSSFNFFTLWYKFDTHRVRVMTEYNSIVYINGNPDASKFNHGEFAYFSSGVLSIKNDYGFGFGTIDFYSSTLIDLYLLALKETLTLYYHQLTFILGNTIQLRVCFTSYRDTAYDLAAFAAECLARSVWSTNIVGRSGFPCQVIFNANNTASKNVINGTYYNGEWLFQTADDLGVSSFKTIAQTVPGEPITFSLFSDDFYKIS